MYLHPLEDRVAVRIIVHLEVIEDLILEGVVDMGVEAPCLHRPRVTLVLRRHTQVEPLSIEELDCWLRGIIK